MMITIIVENVFLVVVRKKKGNYKAGVPQAKLQILE